MKQHGMPHMKEGGVNVTPLIDIVMCLIIFFMLVAKIGVSTGAAADIIPPETFLGAKIEDMGNTLTLNVRDPSKETVMEDGKAKRVRTGTMPDQPQVTALIKATGGEARPIPLRQGSGASTTYPLLDVLRAVVKENPNLRIIILADSDLEYRLLEQVLVTCTEAQVKDFNFQTRRRAVPIGEEAI